MGACPMFGATLASAPSVTAWQPGLLATYGLEADAAPLGLQATPDPEPPRQDA